MELIKSRFCSSRVAPQKKLLRGAHPKTFTAPQHNKNAVLSAQKRLHSQTKCLAVPCENNFQADGIYYVFPQLILMLYSNIFTCMLKFIRTYQETCTEKHTNLGQYIKRSTQHETYEAILPMLRIIIGVSGSGFGTRGPIHQGTLLSCHCMFR